VCTQFAHFVHSGSNVQIPVYFQWKQGEKTGVSKNLGCGRAKCTECAQCAHFVHTFSGICAHFCTDVFLSELRTYFEGKWSNFAKSQKCKKQLGCDGYEVARRNLGVKNPKFRCAQNCVHTLVHTEHTTVKKSTFSRWEVSQCYRFQKSKSVIFTRKKWDSKLVGVKYPPKTGWCAICAHEITKLCTLDIFSFYRSKSVAQNVHTWHHCCAHIKFGTVKRSAQSVHILWHKCTEIPEIVTRLSFHVFTVRKRLKTRCTQNVEKMRKIRGFGTVKRWNVHKNPECASCAQLGQIPEIGGFWPPK
jgi:hypothetical protein